jgi:phenylpropionate dioxygenase-like ring-hydroxylating dioxygenase large terminal subunit
MAAAVDNSVETALTEVKSDKTDTPASESPMLYGFWYRAARTSDIRRGKMKATTMLETQVLVGRDSAGHAFAMRDACPHRGTPLSYGWFDGKQVQCSYHGWKFDALSGQCQGIPSCAQGQDIHHERIFAPRLEVEERDGYIWVYIPEPAGRLAKRNVAPPGPAPVLPIHSEKYKRISSRARPFNSCRDRLRQRLHGESPAWR